MLKPIDLDEDPKNANWLHERGKIECSDCGDVVSFSNRRDREQYLEEDECRVCKKQGTIRKSA